MSKRTRKKSRHNKGRKPLYKEHRDAPVPASVHGITPELLRPRYMHGLILNQGITWSEKDEGILSDFAAAGIDVEVASKALGRTAKTLIHRASDIGLSLSPAWSKLVRQVYRPRVRAIGAVLCYPYVAKANLDSADLLRANALIPKSLPEWMRSDIVQEVMLALYEGTVTLEALEKNREKARWFIAKFYKDQRPYQEVHISGNYDDDRNYEDIAASVKSDWLYGEMNEARGARESFKMYGNNILDSVANKS